VLRKSGGERAKPLETPAGEGFGAEDQAGERAGDPRRLQRRRNIPQPPSPDRPYLAPFRRKPTPSRISDPKVKNM